MLLACSVYVLRIHGSSHLHSLDGDSSMRKETKLLQKFWVWFCTEGVTVTITPILAPPMAMPSIEHRSSMATDIKVCKPHLAFNTFGVMSDMVRM